MTTAARQDRLHRALVHASVQLPWLAGLAHAVTVEAHPLLNSACVTRSGRVLFGESFLDGLSDLEAAYVMAHELMHLALDTFGRVGANASREHRRRFNAAHDYIINDTLSGLFGIAPPAGGLHAPGSRAHAAEEIVARLQDHREVPRSGFPGARRATTVRPSATALAAELARKGLVPPPPTWSDAPDDDEEELLDDEVERRLVPGLAPDAQARARQVVERAALRALDLSRIDPSLLRGLERDGDDFAVADIVEAQRNAHRPPWEEAVFRWLESVTPGPRTYARASRRMGDRTDVVLPGRHREGWQIAVIVDTSGSMSEALPAALGAIGAFANAVGVTAVRVLQCDATVTADEFLEPSMLHAYRVVGGGGSDMSPAMLLLAASPEVEAVIVLTDGDIAFPVEPMPYHVLWACTGSGFEPPYGHVVQLRH